MPNKPFDFLTVVRQLCESIKQCVMPSDKAQSIQKETDPAKNGVSTNYSAPNIKPVVNADSSASLRGVSLSSDQLPMHVHHYSSEDIAASMPHSSTDRANAVQHATQQQSPHSDHDFSHGAPQALNAIQSGSEHAHSPAAAFHINALHSTNHANEQGLSHGAPLPISAIHAPASEPEHPAMAPGTKVDTAHDSSNHQRHIEHAYSPHGAHSTAEQPGTAQNTNLGTEHVLSQIHSSADAIHESQSLHKPANLHVRSGSAPVEFEHSDTQTLQPADPNTSSHLHTLHNQTNEPLQHAETQSALRAESNHPVHGLKLAHPDGPFAGGLEDHAHTQPQDTSDTEGGVVFDIYGEDEEEQDSVKLSPLDDGSRQSELDASQAHKKHVQLCPNCQIPREHNRPTCPACGTHFEERSF